MPQQQEPPKPPIDQKTAGQLVLMLANAHAATILMFLRFRIGVDQPGPLGIVSFIGMGLYAESFHSYLMYQYCKVWLVALIIQRICRDKWKHSLSWGWPWVCALIPPICWIGNREKRARVAQRIEPVFCMLVGVIVMQWDLMFGRFIFCGVFSLTAIQGIAAMMESRLRTEMRNAQIEAGFYR